jgi:hypothetical protein
MTLKAILDNLDGVPEALQGEYTKGKDDKYHLNLEGVDLDAPNKVKEFRTKNIDLLKEKAELEKKFDGVDPEKYKQMLADLQLKADQEKLDAGKVDELIAERTERMKKDYESKITSVTKAYEKEQAEKEALHSQLSEVLIDSEIQKAISKIGSLRKGSMELILEKGRKVWSLEDGHPIARKDGKPIYGKDPQKQIDFDEWAQLMSIDHPYLFEGASGMESKGGDDKGSLGMTNTDFGKKSFSEKMEIATKQLVKKSLGA